MCYLYICSQYNMKFIFSHLIHNNILLYCWCLYERKTLNEKEGSLYVSSFIMQSICLYVNHFICFRSNND
jgi:hypothetical protein